MLAFRSLIFNIGFFTWTAFCSVMTIPTLLMHRRAVTWVAQTWGRGTHFLMKWIVGTTYEVKGWEHAIDGPAIIASKHQSALETTLIRFFSPNCGLILKRELVWIPFFGQAIMKSGAIKIDRSKGKKVMPQLIEGGKDFIAHNRPIFMYPEGTRSKVGVPGKYKSGIFYLYEALKVPVVPIAHNAGYFWGRREFIKRPGHIVYEFLEPIQPGLKEKEFMKTLEDRIETACERLKPQKTKPANPSPKKRKGSLWALVVCAVLGSAGYSYFWYNRAAYLKETLHGLVAQWKAEGYVLSHEGLEVVGFPMALGAIFKNPTLHVASFGEFKGRIKGPILVETNLWNPTILNFSSGGETLLKSQWIEAGDLQIGGFSGTVNVLDADHFSEFSLQKVAFLEGENILSSIQRVTGSVRVIPGTGLPNSEGFGVQFNFEDILLGPDETVYFNKLDRVAVTAHVMGAFPMTDLKSALRAWYEKGGTFELNNLTLVKGETNLKIEGTMALDEKLQPMGAFALEARGLHKSLEGLRKSGAITSETHKVLKAAVEIGAFLTSPGMSKKENKERNIRLSLTLQDQGISLGPARVLGVPEINWDFLGQFAKDPQTLESEPLEPQAPLVPAIVPQPTLDSSK